MVLCGVVGGINVVAVIICIDNEVDGTDIAGLVCSEDEVDSIVVVVTVGIEDNTQVHSLSEDLKVCIWDKKYILVHLRIIAILIEICIQLHTVLQWCKDIFSYLFQMSDIHFHLLFLPCQYQL